MKLLFVQGGSRVRVCSNGEYYVDGNFSNEIWSRYKKYCNNFSVILRNINNIYDEDEIKEKFNYIDKNIIKLILVDDVYSPKINFFNLKIKSNIKNVIENEVKTSDKIIIRSLGNFYTNTALKFCKKYKKDYLVEVTGFAFESLWYHSLFGKIISLFRENYIKKNLKKAPFAVYVTNKELQKRYPSNGKTLGCSDVESFEEENVLERKQKIIKNDIKENKFIFGTAAFLDVTFKGQKDVIRAINYLKTKGINNIYYEMIGIGTGKKLKKLINKYHLNDRVNVAGSLNHSDVKEWMMNLDVYVHPSYSEGLCRSIIEAMKLATPVICSNAGGNVELISNDYIYNKKNWKKLAKLIEKICNEKELINQSKLNYTNSKNYDKQLLNDKRDSFYKNFILK